MAEVIVSMLPVGQGAMNLIEVYEGGQLVSLSLIDCGSETYTRQECFGSMKYVVEKMRLRRERIDREGRKDGKVFDLVMFTHRDSDHYNLFENLFNMAIGKRVILANWNDLNEWSISFSTVKEQIVIDDNYYCFKKKYYKFERIIDNNNFFYKIIIEYNEGYYVTIHYSDEPKGINILANWSDSCWPNDVSVFLDDFDEEVINIKFIFENGTLYCLHGFDKEEIGRFEHTSRNWELEETIFVTEYKYICCTYNINFDKFIRAMEIAHKDVYKTKEDIEKEFRDKTVVSDLITNFVVGGNVAQRNRELFYTLKKAKAISENVFEATPMQSFSLGYELSLRIVERIDDTTMETLSSCVKTGVYNENNATSAVSLLWDDANDFPICLFTGDATSHTFYNIIKGKDKEDLKYLHNCVWTAPHHGAYRTIKGYYVINKEKYYILNEMLNNLAPGKIIISAGYQNNYGHPHYSFIDQTNLYFKRSLPQCEDHDILYNKTDQRNATWWHDKYNVPIYTCVYINKPYVVYCIYHFKHEGTTLEMLTPPDIIHTHLGLNSDTLEQQSPSQVITDYIDLEKNLSKPEVPNKQLFWHR